MPNRSTTQSTAIGGRRAGRTLYFAYGSNMSIRAMRHRCPGARLCGTAILGGFRFQINRHGFANIVHDPRGIVHGALWHLTPRDLVALDAYEEVAAGRYVRERADVSLPGGEAKRTLVYIAANAAPGVPRRAYLRLILDAARDHGFPPEYVLALAAWGNARREGAEARDAAIEPC